MGKEWKEVKNYGDDDDADDVMETNRNWFNYYLFVVPLSVDFIRAVEIVAAAVDCANFCFNFFHFHGLLTAIHFGIWLICLMLKFANKKSRM